MPQCLNPCIKEKFSSENNQLLRLYQRRNRISSQMYILHVQHRLRLTWFWLRISACGNSSAKCKQQQHTDNKVLGITLTTRSRMALSVFYFVIFFFFLSFMSKPNTPKNLGSRSDVCCCFKTITFIQITILQTVKLIGIIKQKVKHFITRLFSIPIV